APLNYLYRKGYTDRVRQYVDKGGCYVTTCWSGEVDDTDLVYLEKHPLEDVLGIAPEEVDVPDGYCENSIRFQGQSYQITGLCGLVHAKSAEVLAQYQHDFYAGYPALTRNIYGKGEAYYIASMNEMDFIRAFYRMLLHEKELECRLNVKFPMGVTVNERRASDRSLWFLQNFNRTAAYVEFLEPYTNIETGEVINGKIMMEAFECIILEKFK
ncbi:MAG: beta-galactosidase trimerization domain-containing protein, partial [Lachnospiraceae bacterium]|nr:beta-galactosidase trimerization domain-containing protein [Lachnospiraceae bacterium]